ncbi:adenosine deaminase-like [Clytia hemisphaerica]|uniref:adenosine deaminase n=1 Tax=Clytia hemisphaerica TaxID=252671 RepID=A0A7M6DMF9_9CNID
MNQQVTASQRQELWDIFQKAPKPQLHLHLDGSLSFNFIMKAAKRLQSRKPEEEVFEKNWIPKNEEELFLWLAKITNEDVNSHFKAEECDNWRAFNFCNKFLQTKEDLIEATFDIMHRGHDEHNINYLEIRFAPVLHTLEGLTEEEVIHAVGEGFEKGVQHWKDLGKHVDGGIIICALRSFPVSDAINLVKKMSTIKHERVLAFDIAGDEGNYPLREFKEALQLANECGIDMTLHAGEWSEKLHDSIIDNIKVAVHHGSKRIGHGVALRSVDHTDELMTHLQAKNVFVEVNLTSNVSDPRNVPSFEEHPLPSFLERNIKVAGLNVDNWLLAGNKDIGRAEPTGEFVRAFLDCGVTSKQLSEIAKTGYIAGFRNVSESIIKDAMEIWESEIIPKIDGWKEKHLSQG